MKIGIFIADSNGCYPVPAVKGGAVSTLVEHLVKENNEKNLVKMELISFYTPEAELKSREYSDIRFIWVKPWKIISIFDSIFFFIFRKIFKKRKLLSYKSIFSLLFYIGSAVQILKNNKYDKIVIENNIPLAWIIKLSKYAGDYYYHLHNVPRINAHCREIFKNANAILCVSDFVAKQIQSDSNPIGPIPKEKTRVLYNCIDTKHFRRTNEEQEIIKCKVRYGIGDNDKVIIFVGRLSIEKGIDKLIEAVISLNQKNIKLLIVGSLLSNTNIQDEYQNMISNMAKKLDNNIIFTGYILQDELPLLYSIADIAVLPSIWDEPAGLTMIEAVACGTPLITTDAGGIPEYVGDVGVILHRDDKLIQNLADSIKTLLTGTDLEKISEKGIEHINNCFSKENYLIRFLECLK